MIYPYMALLIQNQGNFIQWDCEEWLCKRDAEVITIYAHCTPFKLLFTDIILWDLKPS